MRAIRSPWQQGAARVCQSSAGCLSLRWWRWPCPVVHELQVRQLCTRSLWGARIVSQAQMRWLYLPWVCLLRRSEYKHPQSYYYMAIHCNPYYTCIGRTYSCICDCVSVSVSISMCVRLYKCVRVCVHVYMCARVPYPPCASAAPP